MRQFVSLSHTHLSLSLLHAHSVVFPPLSPLIFPSHALLSHPSINIVYILLLSIHILLVCVCVRRQHSTNLCFFTKVFKNHRGRLSPGKYLSRLSFFLSFTLPSTIDSTPTSISTSSSSVVCVSVPAASFSLTLIHTFKLSAILSIPYITEASPKTAQTNSCSPHITTTPLPLLALPLLP